MNFRKLLMILVLLLGANRIAALPIAYSVSGADDLYSVDIATGVSTIIGPLGVAGDFEALAFDPTSGILYTASDGNSLYTINTTTGAATLVGALGVVYNNGGMAFDSSGQGFLITNTGLYSFNKATGAATLIGFSGTPLSGGSFVGSTLYGTGDNGSTQDLVSINVSTGAITSVGVLGIAQSQQSGLTYDAVTDRLYMLNEGTSSFYSVDYNTGVATLVSVFTERFETIAIDSALFPVAPTEVPIFSSIFSLGFLGISLWLAGFMMNRRRS